MHEQDPLLPRQPANALLWSMRRRIARLGVLVTLLAGVLLALVIFSLCACKSVG